MTLKMTLMALYSPLTFQQSPSSFSAVGFLLGITVILAQAAEFKRRPVL